MSELGELYKALRKEDNEDKAELRGAATLMYAGAAELASQHGMRLKRCSESHYQLKADKWMLNIYPGNQRIYRNCGSRAPFLKLPADWTLLDVVEAAKSEF